MTYRSLVRLSKRTTWVKLRGPMVGRITGRDLTFVPWRWRVQFWPAGKPEPPFEETEHESFPRERVLPR